MKLKKKIVFDSMDAMNYYYPAKEYMLHVSIRAMDSLGDVEDLLKKSLELNPELWAPKIFLGELLFKQGKFKGAESSLRKVAEEQPESVSVRNYLARCMENKSKKEDKSENELLYLFENELRKFIRKVSSDIFIGLTRTRTN